MLRVTFQRKLSHTPGQPRSGRPDTAALYQIVMNNSVEWILTVRAGNAEPG